ncbi:MAG: B12-binding domain-containing radical SAM protein [Rhodospirillales bacterium]|jgi:anaerobic magnesium-protoporphyrin IX monomethyl ester cyclase|nr:B12-binding domain-containing radical SAM protein [Rhodospirillales bacterium]
MTKNILIVYVNMPMEPLVPLGVSIISTALSNAGFNTKVFDTTLYVDGEANNQDERVLSGQVKAANFEEVGLVHNEANMFTEFRKLVEEFKPALIGFSNVELTYNLTLELAESIKDLEIPTVMGGVFATFSPEFILKGSQLIDMVCVGEGELAIVELATRICNGEDPVGVQNIWHQRGKELIRPPRGGELLDIENMLLPKFEYFAPERIYRPMSGNMYRMVPVEISRGCPYKCTYCSAPSFANEFKEYGKWLRYKSIDRIISEIEYYIEEYDVEYFYFISETFLAMSKKMRAEFYEKYSKIKKPFWFNTRPETIKSDDIQALEEIGCHRISIGLETGNSEFRERMLQRKYSNENAIQAAQMIIDSKIELSVNNMIGFPDETRKMIFETIEVNRQFTADSHTVSVFQPFRGTGLFNYSVEKGYFDGADVCPDSFSESCLKMPSMTQQDIEGLYRTFNLYRTLDKKYWPDIQRAELNDEEGSRLFRELIAVSNSYSSAA